MPRYAKKNRKKKYKDLKTSRHVSRAMSGLLDHDWKVLQKAAEQKENQEDHVFGGAYADLAQNDRLSVLYAIHSEFADKKRGIDVGGGLGDAFNSVFRSLYEVGIKPFKSVYNGIANFTYPMLHSNSVSEHTHMVATAIDESYELDETQRADYIQDMKRDASLSTEFIDVWVNDHSNPPYALVSVRGSKKASDFAIDDAAILATGHARDLISTDLSRAVKKYTDTHNVEVAAHSLGTSLVCQSISKNPQLLDDIDRVDLFNPASSPINMNNAVSEYSQNEKFYYYENQFDIVGLGQMLYDSPPKNLVMKSLQSINPIKNHTIDQWLPETPLETRVVPEEKKSEE